ncbi:MAG: SpoIIE family protein phosphatase [Desulfobacterales bacterium]|jgi:sigma-B regulation protein RsbU (phosphoserine phosphatase)|nr:SpoIIE family protein phosphatase [Desulfobacterales bacterium]
MKLRWKFFFILLMFSLIPLGILTFVSQRGTSRMGEVISEDVRQNSSRLAAAILKRTAENSAAILAQTKKSFELALAGLAHEAEAVFAEDPPGRVKVYFATDFEDPATAPPDAGPQAGYMKKSADGRLKNDIVSFEHPVVVLAPGVSASDAAGDIDRLTLLTDFFSEIFTKLGPALHWVYVSSESGAHISFPGHGGYPDGYDPRRRPWYLDAAEETRWGLPLVDAATGQVIMTVSKQLRYPDGSPAGVVAMDVLLTEVLRIDALSSSWTAAMQSFLVAPVFNAATQATDLLIVAQKDYQTQASSWEGAIRSERLAVEDPGKMSELTDEIAGGRSGVLEMPYQGVASIWAYAPITPKASFVMIVPREVTDRLPEKTVGAVRAFTAESLLTTALTALGAILLAVLAALAGSRGFTRPMVELADASGRLSRGDFSVRLSTRTGDERDQVIQAFNDMVPKLEDQLRMRESLQLATEVQQNLLPRRDPCLPGLDIAGTSLYCDETGGDYYDFLEVAQDRTGAAAVVVGDVSGHGVQAALLMASARAALRLRVSLPGSLPEIVADVNRQLTDDVGDSGAFMTLFLLSVDGRRKTARWVRAGHDPAIYYAPEPGRFEEFAGRGAPLGMEKGVAFEEQRHADLKPGGIIFIGTDGIWETTGPQGEMFGKQRLREILRTRHGDSAREIIHAVTQALETYRQGVKPADDITMLVVKIL